MRSYPPVPESGEEPEDIESEDIVEEETEAEVPEDDEETKEDDFYLLRRDRPAEELVDTAGSSPSTQEEETDMAVDNLAPTAQKRAEGAFADEGSLWSS